MMESKEANAPSTSKITDDVAPLSQCLKSLHGKREKTLLSALNQLREHHIKKEKSCLKMMNAGALKRLLSLASQSTNAVTDLCLSILGNLSNIKACRVHMIEEGALEVIGDIFMKTESASIQNRSCRTLSNLAHDSTTSCAIHERQGLLARVVSLINETDNKENKLTLLRALRVFSSTKLHMSHSLQLHCIDAILSALKSSSTSVLIAALKCLMHFVRLFQNDHHLHKECDTKHKFSQQGEKEENEEEKEETKKELDAAVQFLQKATHISLSQLQEALTWHLVFSPCGFQALIELDQHKDPSIKKQSLAIVLLLMKKPPLRTDLGNAGFIPILVKAIKDRDCRADDDGMRLSNALAMFSQEPGNRTRIRESGGLELLLDLLTHDSWHKLHHRIISALVSYIYDDLGLKSLLSLGLCEKLIPHLLSNSDLEEPPVIEKRNVKYSIDSPTYREISHSQSQNSLYDPDGPTNLFDANFSNSPRMYSPMSTVSYNSPQWEVSYSPYPSPSRSLSPCSVTSGQSPSSSPLPSPSAMEPSSPPPPLSPNDTIILPEPPLMLKEEEGADYHPLKEHISVDRHIHRDPKRLTQHNVLILLSRVSYLPDPSKHLISTAVIKGLLDYVSRARRPLTRAMRLLHRLTESRLCFEGLIMVAAPNQIDIALTKKPFLRDTLLGNLSTILSSPYGYGTLQHMIANAEKKDTAVLCLPFLCRNADLEKGLMIQLRGLESLTDQLFQHSDNFCMALNSLSAIVRYHATPKFGNTHKNELEMEIEVEPADIEFLLDDGSSIVACKKLLSQHSSVFRAMLTGSYMESAQSNIPLKEVSSTSFQALVDVINGKNMSQIVGDSQPTDEFLLDLLSIASRFIVPKAISIVSDYISSSLKIYSVGEVFEFALLHNCQLLVNHCLMFALGSDIESAVRVNIFEKWMVSEQVDEIRAALNSFMNKVLRTGRIRLKE